MRKKEWKLVITFHTTTDAIAMEQLCKRQGAKGRIIPVPRSITAGCGLAWCVEIEEKVNMEQLMEQEQLTYESMQECMV